MFIGQVESVDFARRKGSKDLEPRKKRMVGQVAAGLGAAAAIGAGIKNRKGLGSAAKAGLSAVRRTAGTAGGTAKLGAMAAGDAVKSGRGKVAGKVDAMGAGMQRKGGYKQMDAATAGGGYKKVDAGTKAGQRQKDRGTALRNMAARIRGK